MRLKITIIYQANLLHESYITIFNKYMTDKYKYTAYFVSYLIKLKL